MIEIRGEVKNFTTVAGVKQVIDLPISLLRHTKTAGKKGKDAVKKLFNR